MKKLCRIAVCFAALSVLFTSSIFAAPPVYTTAKAADGKTIIICPSDDDALILLNEYFLPDKFYFTIRVEDIFFERVDVSPRMFLYVLKGTKLPNAGDYGYKNGLGILNQHDYAVKRHTPYLILLNVEKIEMFGIVSHMATITNILDLDMNPIPRL